ncbi:hypothetical protein [Geobacillus thermodenitrificans]|uniref:hypothetical protein n=1 Tax=Geobacillus thermodenitrificans TaxID=33940 RepID=UPI00142E93F7|nr:hypothetical protein [Geobacillus thermodenitrificans]
MVAEIAAADSVAQPGQSLLDPAIFSAEHPLLPLFVVPIPRYGFFRSFMTFFSFGGPFSFSLWRFFEEQASFSEISFLLLDAATFGSV